MKGNTSLIGYTIEALRDELAVAQRGNAAQLPLLAGVSPWPPQVADGSAPLQYGEGLGVRFPGVRPPKPELFMEDEAGSEHLPKRLDGERLEAGTAGGGPQRGIVPPLWWSLRSTASLRLWPTSRRSPSRLRCPPSQT